MPLLQDKQLIWNEIAIEVKGSCENITLMIEQKIVLKDYEFFILSTKRRMGKMVRQLENSSNILMKNKAVR